MNELDNQTLFGLCQPRPNSKFIESINLVEIEFVSLLLSVDLRRHNDLRIFFLDLPAKRLFEFEQPVLQALDDLFARYDIFDHLIVFKNILAVSTPRNLKPDALLDESLVDFFESL